MRLAEDKKQALDRERIHFHVVRALADNNDFNAVRYLYDRLNIIDSKAQGLLTRNGLLLTVISILGSVKLRSGGESFLSSALEQWAFGAGFILLMASTFMTFSFVRLRFDNVTVIPSLKVFDRLKEGCACEPGGPCADPTRCRAGQASELAARVAPPRTFDEYVDTFLHITLERQRKLRLAQRATITASVLFFLLIGYSFYNVFDHLHPESWPPALQFWSDKPSG